MLKGILPFCLRVCHPACQQLKDCVVVIHQLGHKIRQKLSHNESAQDNRMVYWKEEIEGLRMIQNHHRRIHFYAQAGFYYEDFSFSFMHKGL